MRSGRVVSRNASFTYTVDGYAPFIACFTTASLTPVCVEARSADLCKGAVSGGGIVDSGTQTSVSATPADGYRFLYWSDSNGHTVSMDATYTFAATADTLLTAHFVKLASHTVSASVTPNDAGDVYGTGTYEDGTQVMLQAVARAGYEFDHWEDAQGNTVATSEGDGVTVDGATLSLTVSADVAYTAVFSTQTFALPTLQLRDASHDSWGTVTYAIYRAGSDEPVVGSKTLEYGDKVVFTATPASQEYAFDGYEALDGQTRDATPLCADTIYTIDSVTSEVGIVTYDFVESQPATVTYTSTVTDNNPNRSILPGADMSVKSGTVEGYVGQAVTVDYGTQDLTGRSHNGFGVMHGSITPRYP